MENELNLNEKILLNIKKRRKKVGEKRKQKKRKLIVFLITSFLQRIIPVPVDYII